MKKLLSIWALISFSAAGTAVFGKTSATLQPPKDFKVEAYFNFVICRWSQPPPPDSVGCNVYFSKTPGKGYVRINQKPIRANDYTIRGLEAPTLPLYFVASTCDLNQPKVESPYSKEITLSGPGSFGENFEQLPKPVQATVLKNLSNGEIKEITVNTRGGNDPNYYFYDVVIKKKGGIIELTLMSDGKIFDTRPIKDFQEVPFDESVSVRGIVTLENHPKADGKSEGVYVLVPYILGKPFMVDWGRALEERRIRIIPNGKIGPKDIGNYVGLAGNLRKESGQDQPVMVSLSVDNIVYYEWIHEIKKVKGRRLLSFSAGGCEEDGPFTKKELADIKRIKDWAKKNHIRYEQSDAGDDCSYFVSNEDTVKRLDSDEDVIRSCEKFFNIKK